MLCQMADDPILSGSADGSPSVPPNSRKTKLWSSLFGWESFGRWDVLAVVVPGVFVAVGLGMLGIDWFPHNLLISQICFSVAAIWLVVKVIAYSVKSDSSIRSKLLFSVPISLVVVALALYAVLAIQAHTLLAWDEPEAIEEGAVLTGRELDAHSSVSGVYSYDPQAGKQLSVGNHTLSVTFTALGIFKYFPQTKTVTLVVYPRRALTAVPIAPSERTKSKPRSVGGQACMTPTPDPDLTLIFKPPLLKDHKHQCQIEEALIPFRKYLVTIGFKIPARTLPIGVSSDGANGYNRGYGKYQDYILLGTQALDDRMSIIQTYASFSILPNTVAGTTLTAKDREYWTQAQLAFAYYFSYSFLDEDPPAYFENPWVKAFWEIRRRAGKEFADTLIALAVNSFGDSPTRNQNASFQTYMNDRLGDAENLADSPRYLNRPIIELSLIDNELFAYTPSPETTKLLRKEQENAAKPHAANH